MQGLSHVVPPATNGSSNVDPVAPPPARAKPERHPSSAPEPTIAPEVLRQLEALVPEDEQNGVDRLYRYVTETKEQRKQPQSTPACEASMSALSIRLKERMAKSNASSSFDNPNSCLVRYDEQGVDAERAMEMLRRRPVSQIKPSMIVALPPDMCIYSPGEWASAASGPPASTQVQEGAIAQQSNTDEAAKQAVAAGFSSSGHSASGKRAPH